MRMDLCMCVDGHLLIVLFSRLIYIEHARFTYKQCYILLSTYICSITKIKYFYIDFVVIHCKKLKVV